MFVFCVFCFVFGRVVCVCVNVTLPTCDLCQLLLFFVSSGFVATVLLQLQKLVDVIKRVGRQDKATGQYNVTFGVLFERTDGIFAVSLDICA